MNRTTIMADDALLDRARAVAKREGISLAEVIRQGIALRVQLKRRPLSFIGAIESDGDGNTAAWSADAPYEPFSWR